jgi:hypothetical protein
LNTRILLIIPILLISACAQKSELLATQKQVADLTSKLSALEASATAVQSRVISLQAENDQLRASLNQKPTMPVSVAFRRALTGRGYVALFNTTVKSPVTILATVRSSALGTEKRFELHLDPSASYSLGHLEGAVLDPGDTIVMENRNYESSSVTVTAE